jgi:hypothetical protein
MFDAQKQLDRNRPQFHRIDGHLKKLLLRFRLCSKTQPSSWSWTSHHPRHTQLPFFLLASVVQSSGFEVTRYRNSSHASSLMISLSLFSFCDLIPRATCDSLPTSELRSPQRYCRVFARLSCVVIGSPAEGSIDGPSQESESS